MLFFRSEEQIDRWCATWRLPRGAVMSLHDCWRLAVAWFAGGRTAPEWRRRTPRETEQLFASLGFTSGFWRLT